MRSWKSIVVVAVVVAVAVGVVAGVAGAVGFGRHAVSWRPMMVAASASPGARAGACGRLMSDPTALKAMQALRADHLKDMQAWNAQYGADPTSAAAQRALQSLRQEHWNDMRTLLRKFGIDVPAGSGFGMMGRNGVQPGQGGAWGGWGRSQTAPSATPSPGADSYGPGMMGYGGSL